MIAIERAGYTPGEEIAISLDIAVTGANPRALIERRRGRGLRSAG